MGLLGGIMRAVVNPATIAQLAMGPAGWASLAVRTIGTAIGQQLIQQLGQKLGLPQGMINMAQNTFAMATGTTGSPNTIAGAVNLVADRMGLSPTQAGELTRNAQRNLNDIFQNMQESTDANSVGKRGTKHAGSFLEKIAIALGKVMDDKMNKMATLSDQISAQSGQKGNETQLGTLNGQLAATGQELGIISNAMNNAIKSIGESEQTLARKS
jgi:hypothetical protein